MSGGIICPSVLASDTSEYAKQMHRVSGFARRVQIDLMDGEFASPKSVSLDEAWWPKVVEADIHLMYKRPMEHLKKLINLRPHMVIIHAEADVNHMHFAAELHKEEILAGLAVMPETKIADVEEILHSFDHLLIFSGDLGHFGGTADLALPRKIRYAKEHHIEVEIGWDGGINDKNAELLARAGVDVLNVGGFIQNSPNPKNSYDTLVALAENKK